MKKTKKEKPKYIPVHPKLYPVIKAFHKLWFPKGCNCEFCHESKK